jgi:hypothetical protein
VALGAVHQRPVGAAIVLTAPRLIRESARISGRFDLAGALTSTGGMTVLVYGFIRVGAEGWGDGVAVAAFTAAALLLAAFVAIERRAEQPLMPLRLFERRGDRERLRHDGARARGTPRDVLLGGLVFMPLSAVLLSGVRLEDSGAAAGAMQTSQQLGAALGVAILVSVFAGAVGDADATAPASSPQAPPMPSSPAPSSPSSSRC